MAAAKMLPKRTNTNKFSNEKHMIKQSAVSCTFRVRYDSIWYMLISWGYFGNLNKKVWYSVF